MVLLEQIRTIDKHRLSQRIGTLPDYEMNGINHALAISIGFTEKNSPKMVLCLCHPCANNFFGSGTYNLRRIDPSAIEKEDCTYCGQRRGYDYVITKKRGKE